MIEIISKNAIERRSHLIEQIREMDGDFLKNSKTIEQNIHKEISDFGNEIILDHLRLCGDIPESYGHDSSEEKLYSK